MVEPLVVSPSGVDAIALGDNAAFEHNGVLVQHDGIGAGEVGRSLAFVRDPRFVGTGFFAGEAPDGLTTVYGDPISADVFVYWRDPDDPMAQEVLVGATKSAPDGTWRITGLNYNLRYVVRARASGRDDVTVVGVQPSRSDVIACVNQLVPREDGFGNVDGLTGYVLLDSGLPPFTCEVIQPLPYGLTARIEGRKLLIEGVSIDNGLWESVVRVTASNGVWVDVSVQVQIQVLTDPYFDKVSLLLHMDGADGSTVFIDSSPSPKTVTPNGSAQINAAQSVFGGASGYFDGSGDYLSLAASADFGFGLADFTVEAFIYISGGQGTDRGITDFRATGGNDVGTFFIDGSAGNRLAFWHGAKLGATGQPLALKTWYHVALSRENGVFRCYIDGVQDWARARAVNFGTSRPLGIGGSVTSGSPGAGSSPFMGYIDELRITKGVARYTANFTPPDKPFPNR